jgi:hypothetical protein
VALDQGFDDRAGLGQHAVVVRHHRRFAERVHATQRSRCQHGLRIALVAHDLVG